MDYVKQWLWVENGPPNQWGRFPKIFLFWKNYLRNLLSVCLSLALSLSICHLSLIYHLSIYLSIIYHLSIYEFTNILSSMIERKKFNKEIRYKGYSLWGVPKNTYLQFFSLTNAESLTSEILRPAIPSPGGTWVKIKASMTYMCSYESYVVKPAEKKPKYESHEIERHVF